jgi:hypothetical protein
LGHPAEVVRGADLPPDRGAKVDLVLAKSCILDDGQTWPGAKNRVLACGGTLLFVAADMPLSLAADTVTLPFVIPAAYFYKQWESKHPLQRDWSSLDLAAQADCAHESEQGPKQNISAPPEPQKRSP